MPLLTPRTRVGRLATFSPQVRIGAGGNMYVFCKNSAPLNQMCIMIEKATSSVYWNRKHNCFAVRIKSKKHKAQAIKHLGL